MTETDLSFQHYKVLRKADGTHWELGRGSMGITYKAFDVNLCCDVALKVINAATLEHPHARERFVSEARAAAKLRHRNVASVYHLGNDGEHYFYAMEFVDGETLDALVSRQGPLPVATALRILLQAARALAAASRQGLVHRDLKPANVMVTHEDDDAEMLVKVIDFGLAKPITSAPGSRPLTFGGFVGTPQFASPEQLEERRLDGRSDIYSLGATAWFLLTGHAPFVGSLATICRQHLTQTPPWSQLPKPFPETVRTLLAQMLAKDPARRPVDAVELRRQIEAALEVIREPQTERVPVYKKFVAKPPNWSRGPTGRPGGVPPPTEGGTPRTGMILKGRYELLRLVGEGNSGRVFAARDRSANEALVAVKVLHPELVGTASELDRLGEEVRLIQAAVHPQFIQIISMENLPAQETEFLVEEWLHGFTLLEFLAVRGGGLPVGEALRLVEQAAAAADHAVSRHLEQLDFALHQFHLHFLLAGPPCDDPDSARQPMQTPLSQWPAWVLKLNPLGSLRNGLESSTWAGDVTLVPGGAANLRPDPAPGRTNPALRELYTRGTAQLTYELLGGSPASPVYGNARRDKYVSLPALNEGANAVLQRALSDGTAFASARGFYDAVTAAAGLDPTNLALTGAAKKSANPLAAIPVIRKVPPVVPVAGPLGLILADTGKPDTLLDALLLSGDDDPSPVALTVRPTTTFDDDGELLRGDSGLWNQSEDASPGNAWERLALVSGDGASSRLWLGGVVLAFVGLLVGSIVFLRALELRPAKKPGQPSTIVKSTDAPRTSVRLRPGPTAAAKTKTAITPSPRPYVVPTTRIADIATTARAAKPVPSTATPDFSTPKVPVISADVSDVPPPLSMAAREKNVQVHVDSKPVGVEVSTKGKMLGRTPFDATLPPGDYQLIARYRNWPEVHQSLHVEDGEQNTVAALHMMPPALVPASNVAVAPISRNRREEQDAIVKRNFVRSMHGNFIPEGGGNSPAPVPDVSATPGPRTEVRRATPALDPFDPSGAFRQNPRSRDDG